jgi:hypothetical protein
MKTLLLIASLLVSALCYAQKTDDKKIIITVQDTAGIYERVKIALVKSDFIVKEDGNRDTVTTYPAELKKVAGYSAATVIIRRNIVQLTGVYGLTKVDDFGYTRTPKNYKPIVYYKGSKAWKLLMDVAVRIGQQFTYAK